MINLLKVQLSIQTFDHPPSTASIPSWVSPRLREYPNIPEAYNITITLHYSEWWAGKASRPQPGTAP